MSASTSPSWLTWLVILAAVFALAGLLATIRAALKFGPRRRCAPPAGTEGRGMRYAFFEGMMPQAKESVQRHLPTYYTGILYHLGIAAGFLALLAAGFSREWSGGVHATLLVLVIAGAMAGVGLLVKRAVTPALRAISTPDDVISNGLVTLFLVAAAATLWAPKFATSFLIVTTVLLLYIPLGKIRHCFLFFFSRITFGRFFGRRGVLPRRTAEAGKSHVLL